MLVAFNNCDGGFTAAGITQSPSTTDPLLPPQLVDQSGLELYENRCSECHGSLADSNKKNSNFDEIKVAFASIPQMSFLPSITDDQVRSIAEVLFVENEEGFSVANPAEGAAVSSKFVVSGNCILGATVRLTGSFGTQSFVCNNRYSFVIESSNAGLNNFSVVQNNEGNISTVRRSVQLSNSSQNYDDVSADLGGQCASQGEDVGHNPIRRLSKIQYLNSVKNIVGEARWNAFYPLIDTAYQSIPNDHIEDSITTYMRFSKSSNDFSQDHLNNYEKVAEQAALYFTENTLNLTQKRTFFGSCFNNESTSTSCVNTFISSLGRKSFSRPLSSAETSSVQQVVGMESTVADSMKAIIYYFFMSPEFLLNVESIGNPSNQIADLSQYEVANKISLLLRNSRADDNLLNLAANGQLATAAQKEQAVNDIIADYPDEVRDTYWEFVSEWLGKDQDEDFPYSDKLNAHVDGSFNLSTQSARVKTGMKTNLRNMFEYYTFTQPSTFSDLFTNSNSFTTDSLVSGIHGLQRWISSEDPISHNTPRAGFLTSSAILSSGSASNNPFKIGGLIYKHILCNEFTNTNPPMDLSSENNSTQVKTTRQHFESLTPNGTSCMTCHSQMNPIGFAFEDYDVLGRHRDGVESVFNNNGSLRSSLQVNSNTTFSIGNYSTPVSGAVELIQEINQSEKAHACFVKQYYRFAQARKDDSKDSCTISRAYQTSRSGSIVDIMKTLISDRNFSKRRIEP